MAKNDAESGAIGNRDNAKRGRGLGPGGKKAQPGAKLSGKQGSGSRRSPDDPDTEGYSVGGRGKKR